MKTHQITRITADRPQDMEPLLDLFAQAFENEASYSSKRPSPAYLKELLNSDTFIALAALKDDTLIGGLAAYELKKFEQERSEVYIYDLAVAQTHRRQGIATSLIQTLKTIVRTRGASVIFVQADYGDEPAVALYSKLGVREDVMHFDIGVES